jgi:hypothetical protein
MSYSHLIRFRLSIQPSLFLALAAAISALALTGCRSGSHKTAHLAGTITIAGQAPPSDARVRVDISPTASEQGNGAESTITGNKYDCPNCPLGKVTVYVVVDRPAERASLIDPIYAAGLELDVTSDNLQQDFDLKPFKPSAP